MVKKAIVLAAGLGTRLRPLTTITPKPMMPIWGEPMLKLIVDQLRELGVTDIAINSHYLHEQVDAWATEHGCKVSYEPEILGTGGAINPLREWIGNDDFYLVNGDIVLEGIRKLKPWEALVSDTLGPKTIEIEPHTKYVTCWKSPDPGCEGTFTYLGFACISHELLPYIKDKGFSSIIEAYEKAMMDGKFVKGVELTSGLWTDAGTIENYLSLNEDGEDNAFGDLPQLKGYTDLKFLGHRGSDRCFFKSGDDKIIVIYDDVKRGENAKYVGHTEFLARHGIPVPKIIEDRAAMKTTVMEYCGEPGYKLERYVKVVEALAKFNALIDAPDLPTNLEPKFDAALYDWEQQLFVEQCLGQHFAEALPEEVVPELLKIKNYLLNLPPALVHRDFQSSNILWLGDKMTFIDYQGMRQGPAAYDVASLLFDPYINLGEGEKRALLKLYNQAGGKVSAQDLQFAAAERLIQCLGAYGRLVSIGKTEFAKHIEPAFHRLHEVAKGLGLEHLSELCHHHSACGGHHHHG